MKEITTETPREVYEKSETLRPTVAGAEKWLGVPVPVLDHGFVYLVDYMGSDEAIEQAARVSYGSGTRSVNQTEGLIRYLRRHDHTTPFVMVEVKFHAKMPIFVARQWVRHRTANINEYSGRYSVLDREFYIPTSQDLAVQSSSNKQGREGEISPAEAEAIRTLLIEDASRAYESYEFLLNDDGKGNPVDPERAMLARELARMELTLNYYTQWYWKIDLHNLFHFLNLRMDPHAQFETRQYANAMATIVEDAFPLAYKAFEDFQFGALKLTGPEQEILSRLFRDKGAGFTEEVLTKAAESVGLNNKRERNEMIAKFKKLGLVE